MQMKTDLNSLKKELGRLTDVRYLKKELHRITSEVKKFDVHMHLTPQARERVDHLERRFRELLDTLSVLQKQVDDNFEKIRERLAKPGSPFAARFSGRKARATTKRASSAVAPKTTKKKASSKTSAKAAAKSPRKSRKAAK